jgi:hypothetical protein
VATLSRVACGATQWFGRAICIGATKRAMACKYFFIRFIFRILIKKELKVKNLPP